MLMKMKKAVSIMLCILMMLSASILPMAAETGSGSAAFSVQITEAISPQAMAVGLQFSKTPKAFSSSNVKLKKANGGAEVTITGVEIDENFATLSFEQVLDAKAEYVVILNGIESEVGDVMDGEVLYFTTTENEPENVATNAVNDEFTGTNLFFRQAYPDIAAGKDCTVEIADSGDSEHGKAILIQNQGSGVNNTSNSTRERLEIYYKDKNESLRTQADADTIEISFDFKVPEETYYGQLIFQNTSSSRIIFAFQSNGYLKYHSSYIVDSGDTTGFKPYKINEWNNVKVVISKGTDKKIAVTMNGETVSTVRTYSGSWGEPLVIRFDSETLENHPTTMWFDNLKVSSVKEVIQPAGLKISKTRFVNRDASEAGPLSQGKVMGNANKIKLNFSESVDITQLTAVLTDGVTPVPVSLGAYNSGDNSAEVNIGGILKKDTAYTFTVSGGGMESYSTTFKTSPLGFLFVDDIAIKKGGTVVTAIDETLAGQTLTVDMMASNTLDATEEIFVAITAYDGYEMIADDSADYLVGVGETLTGTSFSDLSITPASVDALKVVILQKTEKGFNVLITKEISNVTDEITEGNYTFKYDGAANSANNDLSFEVAKNGAVYHRDVLKSDADKKYTVWFNMDDALLSGIYDLSVYENNTAKAVYPIHYVNKAEQASVIEYINDNKTNKDSIAAKIQSGAYSVIEDASIITGLSYSNTAAYIMDYIAENGELDESVTANALTVINKAAYANAVSAGLVGNVFDIATGLDLAGSSIGTLYNKPYVGETVQGYVTERLKGCNATSFEKFDNALKTAFVLAVVQKPDGTDNLKEVLNKFYNEIGISQNAESYRYRAVQNKSFESFSALAQAFNNAQNPDNSGNSTGGGGGGGGGSVSTKPSASIRDTAIGDVVEDKTAETMEKNIFSDISEDFWGKTAIVAIAQKGIINGKGDGCFYPNDNVTREEFVKMVVETFGYKNVTSGAEFKDVNKSQWYYSYISAAVENGIINGFEDGNFGVGENISRQDMCVILYRAAEKAGYKFLKTREEVSFEDSNSISDYAVESVTALNAEGIINGYQTGEFLPYHSSTRAECAMVVYNFLTLFNEL